jgi:hypothetical protein
MNEVLGQVFLGANPIAILPSHGQNVYLAKSLNCFGFLFLNKEHRGERAIASLTHD